MGVWVEVDWLELFERTTATSAEFGTLLVRRQARFHAPHPQVEFALVFDRNASYKQFDFRDRLWTRRLDPSQDIDIHAPASDHVGDEPVHLACVLRRLKRARN
jgi:hypothetical protein